MNSKRNLGLASIGLICGFFLCAIIGQALSQWIKMIGVEQAAVITNSAVVFQGLCLCIVCAFVAREVNFDIIFLRAADLKGGLYAVSFAVLGLLFAYGMKGVITLLVANSNPDFAYSFFGYHAYGYVLDVSLVGLVLIVIAQFIVAPLAEELFFRCLLLRLWSTKYGTSTAIILTSIVFMLFHYNKHFYVSIFMFSVLACLLYFNKKSLLLNFLFHSLNNVASFVMQYVLNFQVAKPRSTFTDIDQWLPELVFFTVSAPVIVLIIYRFWPREDLG